MRYDGADAMLGWEKRGGRVPDPRLLGAYAAIGPDEVKRDETIARLKKRLEASGMADFNLDERDMTRDQDVDAVQSSLNTYPMGADFRLVILMGCDRLAEPMRQMLVDYLADPSPTTVLLMTATTLAKNTKLYKAVAAAGKQAIIDCSAKKGRDLPALVQRMAGRHGLQMDLGAAEELIARSGDSTRMLDNELRKLSQMLGTATVSRADVARLVARTAEVKPWEFLDAVSARDAVRALELYRLQPPKSEMRLYSLLTNRLRELVAARALDERGQGGSLAQELGMQGWQVRNHVRWSRRFTMAELVGSLCEAATVEQALKGSKDAESAFTVWVAHICGA